MVVMVVDVGWPAYHSLSFPVTSLITGSPQDLPRCRRSYPIAIVRGCSPRPGQGQEDGRPCRSPSLEAQARTKVLYLEEDQSRSRMGIQGCRRQARGEEKSQGTGLSRKEGERAFDPDFSPLLRVIRGGYSRIHGTDIGVHAIPPPLPHLLASVVSFLSGCRCQARHQGCCIRFSPRGREARFFRLLDAVIL